VLLTMLVLARSPGSPPSTSVLVGAGLSAVVCLAPVTLPSVPSLVLLALVAVGVTVSSATG
jgi:hypothetical protein